MNPFSCMYTDSCRKKCLGKYISQLGTIECLDVTQRKQSTQGSRFFQYNTKKTINLILRRIRVMAPRNDSRICVWIDIHLFFLNIINWTMYRRHYYHETLPTWNVDNVWSHMRSLILKTKRNLNKSQQKTFKNKRP